jgi:dTDP-4-amino-4,6-dideoxygalactose transaminase/CelD/BcsL family acetyltransferase involved in cellulose biosynthesis
LGQQPAVARPPASELAITSFNRWQDGTVLHDWAELISADPDHAYLDADWFQHFWTTFGRGRLRLLRMAAPSGQAVAFAPLQQWRSAAVRHVALLGNVHSPRLDLVASTGWRDAAVGALCHFLRQHRDWDVADLPLLRESSAIALVAGAESCGLRPAFRGVVRQRFIRLDRPWEAIEADFSRSLRTNLRRRRRLLEQSGTLRMHLQTTSDGLQDLLTQCFEVEASGWKGTARTAIREDDLTERFYRGLASRLAHRNRLRLFCLLLDDVVVAFEFCVASGGALGCLKIGYDQALHRLSPGNVLREMLLRAADRMAFQRYDFLGVDTAWKAEWTPDTERLASVRIYNRTPVGQLLLARSRAYRAVAAHLAKRSVGTGAPAEAPSIPSSANVRADSSRAQRTSRKPAFQTQTAVTSGSVAAEPAPRREIFVPQWAAIGPVDFLRLRPRDLPFPFDAEHKVFYHQARNAVFALAPALGWKPGDRVLCPAFHHGVEISALRASGVEVDLFDIEPDLSIDWSRVAAHLHPRTRALYLIHYFGAAQPADAAQDFCLRHGLQLVEDCALSLFAAHEGRPVGSFGDAAIFCLHKTLAVPHGGLLVLRNAPVSPPAATRRPPVGDTLTEIARSFRSGVRAAYPRAGAALERCASALALRHRLAHPYAGIGLSEFDPSATNLGVSALTMRLVAAADWRQIVQARITNYSVLRRELLHAGCPLPVPTLKPGTVPLFLLLRIPEAPAALAAALGNAASGEAAMNAPGYNKDRFCRALWAQGIGAVKTWTDFADWVEWEKFPESVRLRHTLVELPIHQGLQRRHLRAIAECTVAALKEQLSRPTSPAAQSSAA